MTFRLGLTGSIGMGKSTTAVMFADAGCALWDADEAVSRLYGPKGAATGPLGERFPEAVIDGGIDRAVLRKVIRRDAKALKIIEDIVHPLVKRDRAEFARVADADVIVFDIPLLFETGAEAEMDAVACVTVSPEIQRERVLARGIMSPEDLDIILAKQMPNAEKCARADYVIETDTLEHARSRVHDILQDIRQGARNA